MTSTHSQVLREFDPLVQDHPSPPSSVQNDSSTTPPRRATHVRTSSLPAASPQTLSQRRASTHSRTTSLAIDKNNPPHEPPRPEAFDFNLFLEQMRHKSATSIARYVKSFLREFEKKKWTANEQVKIIHDFLEFIAAKMRDCDMWKTVTEQQFENAREGMEKLIMNRLFNHAFCHPMTDDAERDEIVHQKIQIFQWIEPRHLDIPENEHNKSYFEFAQTELLKINSYRAPRDKLICILNCCIVIFGLIRHMEGEAAGADKFLPVLIYVVIKADPEQLVSNIQYIARFRQPAKLESEAGYYLTNLMGVISFLEKMDASSLSITQEEFDDKISQTLTKLSKEKQTISLPPADRSMENGHEAAINLANAYEDVRDAVDSVPLEDPHANSPVPFSTRALESRRPRANTELPLKAPVPPAPEPRQPMSRLGSYFRRNSIASAQPPPKLVTMHENRLVTQKEEPAEASTSHVSIKNSGIMRARVEKMLKGNDYQQALRMLRDMFPNVDPEVCDVVLQANNGHLPPSIETLLDIAETDKAAAASSQ